MRLLSLLLTCVVFLAACAVPEDSPRVGENGQPLPKLYKIRNSDTDKLQIRMLDSVNALRGAAGAGPIQLNAQLTSAAATHALDMSVQNRPWHFGSDGSSPIDRVARTGYPGQMLGEAISETYETELETLAAWMEEPGSRGVILETRATNMGFAWHQEKNGKIWWALVMGN